MADNGLIKAIWHAAVLLPMTCALNLLNKDIDMSTNSAITIEIPQKGLTESGHPGF